MIITSDIWKQLIKKASTSDFEIHTDPQNNSIHLWFKVSTHRDYLIISKAENHSPSVNLSSDRKISYRDFEFVLKLYNRWINGDLEARQEATKCSQNSSYIFALIAEVDRQNSAEIGKAMRKIGKLTVVGDLSAASTINKEIIVNELKFQQVSNSVIFTKGNDFVLSPSVQNAHHRFELKLVDLKQFDRNLHNGFLLIRFFKQFLLADLRDFLRNMVSKENFVKTKVSGVHWKFNIKLVNHQYVIVNQFDKKQFVIKEASLSELRERLGREKRTETIEVSADKHEIDDKLAGLQKKVNKVIENTKAVPENTANRNEKDQIIHSGVVGWFAKIFKG